MAKEQPVAKAQGAEPAKKDNSKSLEKFASDPGNYVTLKQSTEILSSSIFEEEGIDATSKLASVNEFWNERKGKEVRFIASNISTEPEGKNGPYDVVTGTCLDDSGEVYGLTIPQTVVTSTIRRMGLGAYTIKYNGTKRGREQDYADFTINLKRLFKPAIEG